MTIWKEPQREIEVSELGEVVLSPVLQGWPFATRSEWHRVSAFNLHFEGGNCRLNGLNGNRYLSCWKRQARPAYEPPIPPARLR